MLNALTVDVEDYFQVTAFEGIVDRKDWAVYPSRVESNTRRVMRLLDEHGLKGTFFVLGWVAERFPLMVREMADNGHEVACHGFGHELVYNMTPESFRADVRLAKNTLENITGRQVLGYRAPSYSIVERSMWALDVLIEEGFVYDSSMLSVHNGNKCALGAKRFSHEFRRGNGTILELPLTTLNMSLPGRNLALPIAGGGYLRLLPAGVIHWGIRRINQVDRQPAVLYFRPWEIDPDQPRIKARLESRFRHYVNLEFTEGKLRFLFKGLKFGTIAQVLGIEGPTDVNSEMECADGRLCMPSV